MKFYQEIIQSSIFFFFTNLVCATVRSVDVLMKALMARGLMLGRFSIVTPHRSCKHWRPCWEKYVLPSVLYSNCQRLSTEPSTAFEKQKKVAAFTSFKVQRGFLFSFGNKIQDFNTKNSIFLMLTCHPPHIKNYSNTETLHIEN